MVAVNTNRIYSYLDSDNYSFLLNLKQKIKAEGHNNISCSRIIKLAVIELKENNNDETIKQKLIKNEMI